MKLYVTKWVLARGIVVLEGKPVRVNDRRSRREWYLVDIPGGDTSRMEQVRLGSDAFFEEEEARANALERWEEYATKSADVAKRATEGLIRVQRGELQVHMMPRSRISTLTVFETTPFEINKGDDPKVVPSSRVEKKFSW